MIEDTKERLPSSPYGPFSASDLSLFSIRAVAQGCAVYGAKDVIFSTLGALATIRDEKCGLELDL